MQVALEQLVFDQHQPGYQQVTAKVRELITSGVLVPGEKLPSSEELVQRWGLNQRTIHRGMAALVKEGLLDRRPRLGTFVRAPAERLTKVAVYYSEDAWAQGGSPFLQALHAELKAQLAEHQVATDVWIDPRPVTPGMEVWPAMAQAAHQRRIQAVIVPATTWSQIHWLSKLPVPTAYLSSAQLPNCVTLDHTQLFKLALEALCRQGCRSVGLLPAPDPGETLPDGSPTESARAIAAFVDLAGAAGVTLRNEWLRIPAQRITTAAAAQQFGHTQMTELWRQSTRPDGVIVADDAAAIGVMAALLEQGGSAAGRPKIVISKNSAVDIFCPLPATFVEVSTPAIAAALIEQVHKQLRGEPVQPVTVGYRLASATGARAKRSRERQTQ